MIILSLPCLNALALAKLYVKSDSRGRHVEVPLLCYVNSTTCTPLRLLSCSVSFTNSASVSSESQTQEEFRGEDIFSPAHSASGFDYMDLRDEYTRECVVLWKHHSVIKFIIFCKILKKNIRFTYILDSLHTSEIVLTLYCFNIDDFGKKKNISQ